MIYRAPKTTEYQVGQFTVRWDAGGWSGSYRPNSTRKWAILLDGQPLKNSAGNTRTFASADGASAAAREEATVSA